jgi:hypothetical protein
MTTQHSATADETFYLIVTDHDRGVFAVEGPMTDDQLWQEAAREARNHHHRITCGPAGPDRDALAAGQHREIAAMNDPAFIAKVASGVGGRASGRPPVFPNAMPRLRPLPWR